MLHQLAETSPKNSLLILFSDLILPDQNAFTELTKAFNHLKFNKVQLLIFHTLHFKTEVNFDFDTSAPIILVDAETGKEVKVSPAEAKEVFKKNILRQIKKIHADCLDAGIDIHLADVQAGYYHVLSEYLKKRSGK